MQTFGSDEGELGILIDFVWPSDKTIPSMSKNARPSISPVIIETSPSVSIPGGIITSKRDSPESSTPVITVSPERLV